MNNKIRGILLYVGIPLVILVGIIAMYSLGESKAKTQYSDVIALFTQNKVEKFDLNLSSGELVYYLRGQNLKTAVKYNVPSVSLFFEDVNKIITDNNKNNPNDATKRVTYNLKPGNEASWFVNLLPTLLLIGVLIFVWFFFMRRIGSMGGDKTMSFGKAKIKYASDDRRKTTFADVAGADEEKEELNEIVEFLKNPQKFNELGARIPKGVLLVGPPGTGKTLLARAVAGEAGVPFFLISGSDFVEMFVGVGASRVRDLFDQAKKAAPSIIFIDEIDAVGRQRGAGLGGGHDEREQTLNQLLVEMDGFGANEGVIIIAATNRPDILDKALLRPGRFDRHITVNYPDIKGREEILKVHSRGKPLGPDVDLKVIAQSTAGFTGADLENLLNEAALLAARCGYKAITDQNIKEATIKVVMGTEKRSRVIRDKDKLITSYHEAGHAIVSYFLPTQDPVHQISIIPRGMAAGYTMYIPENEKGHTTKTELEESICSLLGGRAAEQATQDDICTGASSDIQRATEIARGMVTKYGMSEKLGPMVFGSGHEEVFLGRDFNSTPNYSEKISAIIDEEIDRIVKTEYAKAQEIISQHMEKLHKVANYLVAREKLDGNEFKLIMEGQELAALEI